MVSDEVRLHLVVENVRQTMISSFRDDEYLFATVDWGQKLTLYQATDAKQVRER